jgi:hypothetical protein
VSLVVIKVFCGIPGILLSLLLSVVVVRHQCDSSSINGRCR